MSLLPFRPVRRLLAVPAMASLLLAVAALPSTAATTDGAEHRAFAVGSVLHGEGIEQPELGSPTSVRALDVDAAFSAAAHDSAGLPQQQTTEYGGTFQPATTADDTTVQGTNAYGRGFGVDVSLGQEGQADGQVTLAGLSEAVAPPPSQRVVNEVGPLPADPFAYGTTLRGEAEAAYANGGVCPTLGGDISYGRGLAADLQLIDADGAPDADENEPQTLEQPIASLAADDPQRAVSSSLSHTFLAAQTDAAGDVVGSNLAVVAETRQTIAPVTLFAGTENEVTIELLGEWVLRAVATGVSGTAHVHYGPGEASPETPLVRIIESDTTETILTTQDLFGDEGQTIDASPLVSLTVGEDPRAIDGDVTSTPTIAGDGTAASAAVDVVRLQVASEAGTGEVAEVRLGHMEVSAVAPAGGIDCELPVSKTSSEQFVEAGDTFTYTITVDNPHECPLTNVRIDDSLEATDGVTWTVVGTDPVAAEASDTTIVWEGLGPIAPGDSLSVQFTVTVGDDSADGRFRDEVLATARCEGGPVEATTDVTTGVDLDGSTVLEEPSVGSPTFAGAERPDTLADTGGGALGALLGLGALGTALGLRRRD